MFANAITASEFAPRADPALNPNHPNHSSPVPRITYGTFAGLSITSFLLPKNIAPARAANPADICTTVPPAKSKIPQFLKRPSGCQVMCASGLYISRLKSTIKKI